jgi:hypothetical protein
MSAYPLITDGYITHSKKFPSVRQPNASPPHRHCHWQATCGLDHFVFVGRFPPHFERIAHQRTHDFEERRNNRTRPRHWSWLYKRVCGHVHQWHYREGAQWHGRHYDEKLDIYCEKKREYPLHLRGAFLLGRMPMGGFCRLFCALRRNAKLHFHFLRSSSVRLGCSSVAGSSLHMVSPGSASVHRSSNATTKKATSDGRSDV